ncbi:MAG: MFS transporter [Planctomycetota bacterium]
MSETPSSPSNPPESSQVTDNQANSNSTSSDSQTGPHRNLLADRSFLGMISTQFLGAFNDNLYKQLMLLMAVPVVVAGANAAGGESSDLQGWAGLVFSLPFVLFSGIAGYLSDRYSKTPIINLCKIGEIVVMLLGLLAFYSYDMLGMAGTWIVLFLMGTQSSFFGPGKYGILPELFREEDLPRANGLILMTTFLAIIFGTVAAGLITDKLRTEDGAGQLWIGMIVAVTIAVLGTATSYMVRRVPPAHPEMKLTADCFGVSKSVRSFLMKDKALLAALLVSSVFWLVSGIAVPVVNRLGRWFEVSDFMTSLLTASIGFGIMIGALFSSWLCRRGLGDRCVSIGLWGLFGCLVALGIWIGEDHLLGYGGSIAALILLGVFAAIFSIPIQVFIQARPPGSLKGRMIATMNQANFTGILIAGPLYQLFEAAAEGIDWPISSVFWMMALLVLPLALLYRLKSNAPLVDA